MNVINSKKENLRVVVFCKEPLKLKSEDVSSFDYVMQVDFNEVYDGLFNEPLQDFPAFEEGYPAIYDVKNIGIYDEDELKNQFSQPLTSPFTLFDLIFSEGKIFNSDFDIERFAPGLNELIEYSNIIFFAYFVKGKSLNTLFDEMIEGCDENINNKFNDCSNYLKLFLLLDEKRLYKLFDFYYENVVGVYDFVRHSSSLKSSIDSLYELDYRLFISCSKYYYSIGNIEKGNMMLFLGLYTYTKNKSLLFGIIAC